MKSIEIVNFDNQLRTDSRLLASALDHRHRIIYERCTQYMDGMLELGHVPVQTERVPVEGQGDRVHKYMLLNEDQCYFLLTLMRNNDHVVRAKLNLVKAFRDARAQLAERDIARLEGKQVRRLETESIKALVDYATAQGSKSASMYYTNVTTMTNKLIGIEAGRRDTLNTVQLQQISVIETVISMAIRDGIKAELGYKDIYRLAKMRSESLVQALAIK